MADGLQAADGSGSESVDKYLVFTGEGRDIYNTETSYTCNELYISFDKIEEFKFCYDFQEVVDYLIRIKKTVARVYLRTYKLHSKDGMVARSNDRVRREADDIRLQDLPKKA